MHRVQGLLGQLNPTLANATQAAAQSVAAALPVATAVPHIAAAPTAAKGESDGDAKERGPPPTLHKPTAAGSTATAAAGTSKDVKSPLDTLKWNGWGYKDTSFALNGDGLATLNGNRYLFSGQVLPDLRKWMEDKIGLDVKKNAPPQAKVVVPTPIKNDDFIAAFKSLKAYSKFSFHDDDRLFHGHGHTTQELFALRYGALERVPDMVVWPGSHEHCEALIKLANEFDVVLIPFGGGTTVSHSVLCPVDEKRMIVSVDMHDMNRIKWINRANMTACIEAGAVGKEIEQKLAAHGLVFGHEPDSYEFSTMGGWIATRASGMRKNKYGNIEDLVVHIKFATSIGLVEKSTQVPRQSTGPDVHHMILGSEGILGIVTEVIVKLRPAPEQTSYGSMIFPTFESGVDCLKEIALLRCAPVSIRLVDNMQFQFGQALKPVQADWKHKLMDKLKKWYITKHLEFDVNKMCAATLLFEGTKAEVAAQEKQIYSIAEKYGGMKAGEENGIRGYFLTYMIAYLRDFGYNFTWMSESFETSIPYENVLVLCDSVKKRIRDAAAKYGVQGTPFISCRVTQLYDVGAAVYFYFAFVWTGLKDPVKTFSDVEHEAREEILKLGGSLSHHHGIGKIRKGFFASVQTETSMEMLRALKAKLDPKNIFAAGNLI